MSNLKPYDVNIELYGSVKKPIIEYVQGDSNAYPLYFTLRSRGEMYNLSDVPQVIVTITKPSRNVVQGIAEIINPSTGFCRYIMQGNEISEVGECECQVQVFDGVGGRLTWQDFSYNVRPQLDDGSAVPAQPEYNVLIDLINQVSTLSAGHTILCQQGIEQPAVKYLQFTGPVVTTTDVAENLTTVEVVGGSSGDNSAVWKPTVTVDGELSWEKSYSLSTPETQNIKGDRGDPGDDGKGIEIDRGYFENDNIEYIRWRYIGDSEWHNIIGLFELKGDPGLSAAINVIGAITGEPGTPAKVENLATQGSNYALLRFTIPRGDKGEAATVDVGSTTILPPGSPATVENVGTPNAAILNFGIPTGGGDAGVEDVLLNGVSVVTNKVANLPAYPTTLPANGGDANTVGGLSPSAFATAAQGIKADNAEPAFAKNTAFNKDFGATAGTVTQGNDPRLSDARPASDVYAWAKSPTKPTYTAAEVGAATTAQGAKADTALQFVPDATASVKGIVLLGATNGAARYGQKADAGLGNVDNTSDASKPLSAAQKTYIDLKTAPTAFTIPTSAWGSSTTYAGYSYQALIPVSGLVTADMVELAYSAASRFSMASSSVDPIEDTTAGAVIVYAKAAPTVTISGAYVIHKAV